MPLYCPVCQHLAAERIEADLGRGLSQEVVMSRYGLTPDALSKHLNVCCAPPTHETVLAQAVALQRAALRVLNRALLDSDTKTALAAMAAADKHLTTIGKMIGAFTEAATVDMRQTNISLALGDLSLAELRQLASFNE